MVVPGLLGVVDVWNYFSCADVNISRPGGAGRWPHEPQGSYLPELILFPGTSTGTSLL